MYYRSSIFAGGFPPPAEFWNDVDKAIVELSNYQMTFTADSVPGGFTVGLENVLSEGKWYFEVDIEAAHASSSLAFGFCQSFDGFGVGVMHDAVQVYYLGIYTDLCRYTQAATHIIASGTVTADDTNSVGFTVGDRLRFAMDFDAGKIWVGKNGTWMNGGDPEAGTNPQWSNLAAWDWRFFASQGNSGVDNTTHPVVVNLCTGSNIFPQLYAAPAGFNPVLPISTEDHYAGFNMHDRDLNNLWKHGSDAIDEAAWRYNGTLFIADASGCQGVGVMRSPEKYYWEMRVGSALIGTVDFGIGSKGGNGAQTQCLMRSNGTLTATPAVGIVTNGSGAAFLINDEVQFAMDLSDEDNIKLWIRINGGAWLNSGDPVAGTNPTFEQIPVAEHGWCQRASVNNSVGCFLLKNSDFTHSAPAGFRTGVPVSLRGDTRLLTA